MIQEFTVDYFIKKFEAIPEKMWITKIWNNFTTGQSCVNGHCGVKMSDVCTDESLGLKMAFTSLSKYTEENFLFSFTALQINDGCDDRYQQPTPKQRILAALYDIKKMSNEQEVQVSDTTKLPKEPEAGTKIIHVYHSVSVPESITKQSKDLILQ